MNRDEDSQELASINYSSSGAMPVHGHTASGTVLQPSNHGGVAASSIITPPLVEEEPPVDDLNDPYYAPPVVGTGMENAEGDPAAQAKRRAMAFSGSEAQRRILVLVDETDCDSTAEPQQQELQKLFVHWHNSFGSSLQINVKLFAYVAPRSRMRYLMFQSPGSVRGKVCDSATELCQKLKHRIEAAIATNSLFANGGSAANASNSNSNSTNNRKSAPTVTVDIHVDSETSDASKAIRHVVTSYRPSLVLMSDRKDQNNTVQRTLWQTSQEVLVHLLVNDLKTMTCIARPVPPAIVNAKTAEDTELKLRQQQVFVANGGGGASSGGGAPSAGQQPAVQSRTFVCCINTQAIFGSIPTPVLSAAALCSPGDHLVIYAAYNVAGDVAASVYTPDGDWTDRVRGEMNATKDTVARVAQNLRRTFPSFSGGRNSGVSISTHISDDPFEKGLQKYVSELVEKRTARAADPSTADPNVVVVVGTGKNINYFGSGIIQTFVGDKKDRVRRQIPNVTFMVTPPSKAGW